MVTDEHKKALNRERCRRWREAHPDRKKEQAKRWEQKNPEYQQEYYEKNKERIKLRVKTWGQENSELKASYDRKRRATKYETRTETYVDSQVLEQWGNSCYICNKEINLQISGRPGHEEGWEQGLHIDHVIPLSLGGTDTLSNVRPTHAVCNLRKSKLIKDSKDAAV